MYSTDISLKNPFISTCAEIFPMFNLDYKFLCELPESSLNSCEPVNIIIGLTNGVKGNLVLGLTQEAAFAIVSGMVMDGKPVTELDEMAKSALCEFMTMLCGNVIGKIHKSEIIRASMPILVAGKKVSLMISKTPSKKLFFTMGNTKFNLAYCFE